MREAAPGRAPVSRVARSSVAAFFVYSAGFGLTYCSQFVIARILGVDAYGVYAYVFAWIRSWLTSRHSASRSASATCARLEAKRDWPRSEG